MKLAVTGRTGQVVLSLSKAAAGQNDLNIITLGRPYCDLREPQSVKAAIEAARPDIVVSAAAYTAVDQAEDESDLAFAVNAVGAGAVASAAAAIGVPIIHLSTDYVFDGDMARPYDESDRTAPKSVYGASKLAGEVAVAAANPRSVILRTAWVYSPFGNNFLKSMLRLAADRCEISVVSDQWGNPTSAGDIADGVLTAARKIMNDGISMTTAFTTSQARAKSIGVALRDIFSRQAAVMAVPMRQLWTYPRETIPLKYGAQQTQGCRR